jgi:hypothetical protein
MHHNTIAPHFRRSFAPLAIRPTQRGVEASSPAPSGSKISEQYEAGREQRAALDFIHPPALSTDSKAQQARTGRQPSELNEYAEVGMAVGNEHLRHSEAKDAIDTNKYTTSTWPRALPTLWVPLNYALASEKRAEEMYELFSGQLRMISIT